MRKTLSVLLVCVMLLTMLPSVVLAEPANETETAAETSVTGVTKEGFAYSILNDEVTITGYTGEAVTVTLPETVEGCPVVAIGDSAFANNEIMQEIVLPDALTKIGNSAFENCTILSKIDLPDGLTEIGERGFFGCKSLAEIAIPAGVKVLNSYLFSGCTSLSKVTLSEGLEEIQWYVFRRTAITDIALPSTLTTLGGDVFDNCQQLTTIVLPSSLHTISEYTFEGCAGLEQIDVAEENTHFTSHEGVLYTKDMTGLIRCPEGKPNIYILPDGVTTIAKFAFRDCTKIKTVMVCKGITEITAYSFYGCSGLETVQLPYGIVTIGDSAFEDCVGLKHCAFPNSLTEIKSAAFRNCVSLEKIELPLGMKTLGDRAFYGCTALDDVTLSPTLTFIGENVLTLSAYYNNEENWTETALYWDTFLLDVKIETTGDFTVKEGTTLLAGQAFSMCSKITSVAFPSSLEYVGYSIFYDCTGLEYLDIADAGAWCGVRWYENPFKYARNLRVKGEPVNDLVIPWGPTRIEQLAFAGCDGLKSVVIPGSVEVIDIGAFYECENLKTVTMPDSVTDVDDNAFSLSPVETLKITGNELTTTMLKGCYYTLKNIELPDTVYSIHADFGEVPLVTSLTIPSSVRVLDGYFYGSGITTLNISDLAAWCAMDMGSDALSGIEILTVNGGKLTDLVIPNGVTKLNDHVFCGYQGLKSVTIPDGVTEIGRDAFRNCKGLVSVTVKGQPKRFVSGAFGGCTSLTELHIDDVATWCAMEFEDTSATPLTHAEDLFVGNSRVGRLTIPDGVESIGNFAFYNATQLTGVVIPDSVTYIGRNAFGGTVDLRDVLIEDLKTWCTIEFEGSGANPLCSAENLYIGDELVTKLEFPENVDRINDHAFSGFDSLTEVVLPTNLSHIGMDAFANCAALTTLTVPETMDADMANAFDNTPIKTLIIADGAKAIWSNMIAGKPTLEQVIIPESVTEIGTGAFANCPMLSELTLLPHITKIAKKSIGYDVFGRPLREVTITGYRHTAAEEYATENNFPFVALNQSQTDETSGIKIEETASASIPEGATLFAQVVETKEDEVVFEIRLEQDGVTVQPNGEITVGIPVPDGMVGGLCDVYRLEEDGSLTDMQATFTRGLLTFTTDHFSVYIVKEESTTPEPTVTYGDVDGVGGVTAADALLALQAATGKVSLEEEQVKAADVDKVEGVSANDALVILQFATKKIAVFPIDA